MPFLVINISFCSYLNCFAREHVLNFGIAEICLQFELLGMGVVYNASHGRAVLYRKLVTDTKGQKIKKYYHQKGN